LTPAAVFEKLPPQAMWNRGTAGSFNESHRAKSSHPDRRNFLHQSGESDAKKATGVKATDAANAYEHILTIQNAADLEFPATDPANAPARAEFKLGIFPPDHHVPPATPTPTTTPPVK
jgi:hypothetical protein